MATVTSRDFTLPVDSEHKAAVFRPWTFKGVHMTAFHASWVSFFVSFLSSFAPAALIPVIRDNLNLTSTDIGTSGIATVSGVIFARISMGILCDEIGPRFGHAGLTLLTAPAVFGLSLSTTGTQFIMCRYAPCLEAEINREQLSLMQCDVDLDLICPAVLPE